MSFKTMNQTPSQADLSDGFERWFFGDDPDFRDDRVFSNASGEPAPLAIDENDSLIPAFSHRCDCGQHRSLLACLRNAEPAPHTVASTKPMTERSASLTA